MKKIALVLTIVILGTAAFAAKLPTKMYKAAEAPAPAPVAASSGDSWSGKMAVGAMAVTGVIAANGISTTYGIPVVQFHFNKEVMGTFGVSYASGNNVTNTIITGKVDYTLRDAGAVQNTIGGYFTNISTTGVQGSTMFGGTYGFRSLVQPNLAISGDLIVFAMNSAGGVSTTLILPGAILTTSFYF
ncbi:MAG: hypothetical protein ABIH50_06255 [bacterium]